MKQAENRSGTAKTKQLFLISRALLNETWATEGTNEAESLLVMATPVRLDGEKTLRKDRHSPGFSTVSMI